MSSIVDDADAGQVAEVINPRAGGRFVIVCEHASNHIPAAFNDLGLDAAARRSHIAWDPGALPVARAMSDQLASPLVASCISRLVYDCNRPPTSPAAIAARSERYDIPGNADLSDSGRAARIAGVYEPFHETVAEVLSSASPDAVLVTVHSFSRIYFDEAREVEIGILHDTDSRLADLMLATTADHTDHAVRRNEPYSPEDGVTHTLKIHALANGLANVMLEIRSDLIEKSADQERMANLLCSWLATSAAKLTAETEAVS